MDVQAIIQQQRELNEISGDIVSLRRNLATYRDDISLAWHGPEVSGVIGAIDDVLALLNWISGNLDDIGKDMVRNAQEIETEERIRAEESARQAEENARREREEAEARERQKQEEAAAAQAAAEKVKKQVEDASKAISKILKLWN